ncbi:MAG: hypothetical protein J7K61_05675 [Thermoplasmata archaeon]|nr:hypothetical protein [Thermoplasmata archaeon]
MQGKEGGIEKNNNLFKAGHINNSMRGWVEVDTFGEDMVIYKKGRIRRLVDEQGNIVLEYELDE